MRLQKITSVTYTDEDGIVRERTIEDGEIVDRPVGYSPKK